MWHVSLNGIFSNKKEWRTNTYYNTNESWEQYAKWIKPDTKGHIWFHLQEIYKNTQIYSSGKISGCLDLEGTEGAKG